MRRRAGSPTTDQLQEIAMDGKSSASLLRPLVAIALVAVTCIPSVRTGDATLDAVANELSTDRAASAPIVLAQRCFNGRCF
jgi:hypothetical protein